MTETIKATGIPLPLAHYSVGSVTGSHIFPAGQIASDYRTGVPPEARLDPAFPFYGSEIQRQTRYVLGNLMKVLEGAGASAADVVKTQVFLTDLADFFYFDQVWKEFFPEPVPRTTVEISRLLVPGCKVEIDLQARAPDLSRIVLKGEGVPVPLAHYSQGVLVGDHAYPAGQIASDYVTGVAPEAKVESAFPFYGSDIKRQTRYVLKNLEATLKSAGCSLADVVKSQVFMTDLDEFFYFDEVWKEFFPDPVPRTTLEVSRLLVPGCKVEIDLVAIRPDVPRERVASDKAPSPLAHYCQGIATAELVYPAGQIASDYETGVPPEARNHAAFPYYGSDIKRQTEYVLTNLAHTLEAAGSSLDKVVKSQVFLTDLDEFFYFDEVWKRFFPTPVPRTTVEVSRLLVPGCKVEIDLIAAR